MAERLRVTKREEATLLRQGLIALLDKEAHKEQKEKDLKKQMKIIELFKRINIK